MICIVIDRGHQKTDRSRALPVSEHVESMCCCSMLSVYLSVPTSTSPASTTFPGGLPPTIDRCRADDKVRCADGTVSICNVQLCDGVPDCPGGDDEANCPPESGTDISGFKLVMSSVGPSVSEVGHAAIFRLFIIIIQEPGLWGPLEGLCVVDYGPSGFIGTGKFLLRLNDCCLLKEDSITIVLLSLRLTECMSKSFQNIFLRCFFVNLHI